MVAEAQLQLSASSSSANVVTTTLSDSVETTTTTITTRTSSDIPAPNAVPTSSSNVAVDDSRLFPLLQPQQRQQQLDAHEHILLNGDSSRRENRAVSNEENDKIPSSPIPVRPRTMMGFRNHTMMNEYAAVWEDDTSIASPSPATEIQCILPDNDAVSTISSITRATSMGESAASRDSRLARVQHLSHLMSGEMAAGPVPSTIGGMSSPTPPLLPIGAFYEQNLRRRGDAGVAKGSAGGGDSSNSDKQQQQQRRPNHDKQAYASALSTRAAKMPVMTPPSPRRPCHEKTGTSNPVNRLCSSKQVANGSRTAARATQIVSRLERPTTTSANGQSSLECNNDMESDPFSTNALAVARLVLSSSSRLPATAAISSSSLRFSQRHDAQGSLVQATQQQQRQLLTAEAAREEFRRQVRSELLQGAVRAEPVSLSSSLPPRHSTTTTDQSLRFTGAKRMAHCRTTVVVFGVLMLLVLVAVAATVGATLGRESNVNDAVPAPSKTTNGAAGSSSSATTSAAPPQAIVYLNDGRQAFTSTQQLYEAVDDYLQTNQDNNDDEIIAVNSSTTSAALTYGYPIGTWDVSRISNFSLVFCPDRYMTLGSTSRLEKRSAFNEDLGGWNVSNAVTMHGLFAACTAFVGEGIENWDTSRVQDFSFLLFAAKAVVSNLSTWNTSSATNLMGMFAGAEAYNGDMSSWDLSKVHSTARMFDRSFACQGRGVSEWNVANVRDMGMMFEQASVFNSSVSAWDTSNVENMAKMFHLAETFNGDLSSWQVGRVSTLEGTFAFAWRFQGVGLSSWNTSRVTSLKSTFALSAFNGDLSRWDVGLVKDFSKAFDRAQAFKGGDLSRWNTTAAKRMRHMFEEATLFNSDLSRWNVSGVEDLERMFAGASSFNYSLCSWGPQLPTTANVQGMFDGSAACETQSEPSALNLSLGPFCQFCG